ncbi:MAG: putative peptidase [Rhodospirillales bacterium]|nr:putative peptidase [Rhodospirillales bacterium]
MNMYFRRLIVLVAGLVLLTTPVRAAIQIQRVTSPGGIEAWLVEDHRIPLMALNLSFRGGAALDPTSKEGLALMTASLLDEGAGDLTASVFQKEMADKSIALSYGADQDSFSASLKTLTKFRDRAFDMLSLSLTKPRFDADAVERVRNEMVTSIATSMGNPGWVARRKLSETVFAGHPYARPANGTIGSIRAITVPDMRQFIKTRLGRDQLLITAAGDITPAELGPALDRMFAGLPAKAAAFTVPDVVAKAQGETIVIQRDIPQTVISMAEPGITRNDPDWYTGQIINYTLGGGGFQSRLMEAVRGAGSKKGLSYGFSSAFVPYKHSGLILAGGSTKNATAGETLKIVKDEFGKMHKEGITKAELDDAKTYITGSFPLSFTSTDRLAALLMQLRVQDLGIDYLDRRDGLINAVTLEDAKRVSEGLLNPAKLTTITVGKPQGVSQAPAAN